MRTFDRVVRLAVIALGVGLSPAIGFDGNVRPDQRSPVEAFRSGAQALRAGEQTKAVSSLEYAAEQGVALAQWQLGRMYATGQGVARSDLRAFEYFGQIADSHAEDSPNSPQARIVSNAFVALGQYYLDGIPDSQVKADPSRARRMSNADGTTLAPMGKRASSCELHTMRSSVAASAVRRRNPSS